MRVFDFDNTIYDGESGLDIFLFYLKKEPKLIARYIPKVGEGFVRYKMGKVALSEVKSEYGYILRKCCAQLDDIDQSIVEFWDKHEKKIKSFYLKIRRDDDVIVSACPEVMLSEICRRIGVQHFIGTEVDLKTGEIGRLCYREAKITAYREQYGDVPIDEFYTDSVNDRAMMDIARDVYFVTGDRVEKIKADGVWLKDIEQ